MTKLTRKLWVGIGAATIAGASTLGGAAAQHGGHKADPSAKAPTDEAAAKDPAQGGEAYLTDGGPRDSRIRFYRDLSLIRGHIRIGTQLVELGLWDEALPHFLHPTEELYNGMEKYIKGHNIRPFKLELGVLAQAVKAKRKGAYDQAQKVVDQRITGALDRARKFMTPCSASPPDRRRGAQSCAQRVRVLHRGRQVRQARRVSGQPRLPAGGRVDAGGLCRRSAQG
jgi:hypothetical protein